VITITGDHQGQKDSLRMKVHFIAAAVAAVLAPFAAAAQEMQMQEAPSLPALSAAPLPARTIAFTDHRKDELVDPITGMIRFDDWQRLRPQEKKLLTLFPSYEEPMAPSTEAPGKMRKRRLYVYVAEARFAIPRPAESIDLSKLVTLPVLDKLDPSIKHKVISPADIIPNKDPKFAANKNPDRPWCEGTGVLCIQSNYKLEGRLPTGIMLVNKIRESGKQIADFLDFQSELRVIPPAEIEQMALPQATGVDTPVVGAIEQNIFYINQVMQFGKFLAVLQPNPTDPKKSIATAFIALAVDSDLFEKKKEFESVPVLRNLVPAQVLAGNSSFNTGNSISAGLPKYSRNRIRAIAALLEKE
jgi:hypothetical protein